MDNHIKLDITFKICGRCYKRFDLNSLSKKDMKFLSKFSDALYIYENENMKASVLQELMDSRIEPGLVPEDYVVVLTGMIYMNMLKEYKPEVPVNDYLAGYLIDSIFLRYRITPARLISINGETSVEYDGDDKTIAKIINFIDTYPISKKIKVHF